MLNALCRSYRGAGAITGVMALVLWGSVAVAPAAAAGGPFASFNGQFSGSGTIRNAGKTERIRCTASYRPQGSTGHEINLQLRCNSDSYNFNLGGTFRADESNHVSGNWTEHTRNVGGTAIGVSRGNRFQLHVESSAFSATMYITSRGSRQSVSIDGHGGGQDVKASLSLHRR
jgi:hypothetical protein